MAGKKSSSNPLLFIGFLVITLANQPGTAINWDFGIRPTPVKTGTVSGQMLTRDTEVLTPKGIVSDLDFIEPAAGEAASTGAAPAGDDETDTPPKGDDEEASAPAEDEAAPPAAPSFKLGGNSGVTAGGTILPDQDASSPLYDGAAAPHPDEPAQSVPVDDVEPQAGPLPTGPDPRTGNRLYVGAPR